MWQNSEITCDTQPGRPHVRGAVRALAVTSDGKLVSGGGIDGALLLWNPASHGGPAREIGRHDGVVLADGRILAVADRNAATYLWTMSSPRQLSRVGFAAQTKKSQTGASSEDHTHGRYHPLFSRRYGVARSDLKGCPENAGSSFGGTIMEANLDGTGVTTLESGQNIPRGVAVDSSHIYWTDGSIVETNLDGTSITTLDPIQDTLIGWRSARNKRRPSSGRFAVLTRAALQRQARLVAPQTVHVHDAGDE